MPPLFFMVVWRVALVEILGVEKVIGRNQLANVAYLHGHHQNQTIATTMKTVKL